VSQTTDLADRYGRPSPRRRQALVAACVAVAAAFLGWLGWTIWEQSTPAVQSNLVGYEVVDDHEATAKVDAAVADDASDVRCTLRAYAEDHTVVGEKLFTPDDGRNTISVRTERLATSVELLGCTADGQNRPR
jgi:hypothetical protein